MVDIPDMPWEGDVDDDDPCQVVKEQESKDTVLIKCRGTCKSGSCTLQKRRKGSARPWEDVPDDLDGPVKKTQTRDEWRCACL
jgi:hypothetical protein